MPLAGRVTLVVIRDGLVSTRTMDIIEDSVRDLENTMGEIFPTKSVAIVLQGDASYFAFDGIRIAGDVFDDEAIYPSRWLSTNCHTILEWRSEVDHGRRGDVLGSRSVGIRTGRLDLTEFRELGRECPVDSIVEINNEQRSHAICPYTLGGSLFLELYDNLGEFAEAFGDIYYEISVIGSTYAAIKNGDVWYAASNRCLECAGLNPGLYYVQRAFLNSASPESAWSVLCRVGRDIEPGFGIGVRLGRRHEMAAGHSVSDLQKWGQFGVLVCIGDWRTSGGAVCAVAASQDFTGS